jgi:hypothetical protein
VFFHNTNRSTTPRYSGTPPPPKEQHLLPSQTVGAQCSKLSRLNWRLLFQGSGISPFLLYVKNRHKLTGIVNTCHLLYAYPRAHMHPCLILTSMCLILVLSFQTHTPVTSNPITGTRSKMSITVIKENYTELQFDWHYWISCDYPSDGSCGFNAVPKQSRKLAPNAPENDDFGFQSQVEIVDLPFITILTAPLETYQLLFILWHYFTRWTISVV